MHCSCTNSGNVSNSAHAQVASEQRSEVSLHLPCFALFCVCAMAAAAVFEGFYRHALSLEPVENQSTAPASLRRYADRLAEEASRFNVAQPLFFCASLPSGAEAAWATVSLEPPATSPEFSLLQYWIEFKCRPDGDKWRVILCNLFYRLRSILSNARPVADNDDDEQWEEQDEEEAAEDATTKEPWKWYPLHCSSALARALSQAGHSTTTILRLLTDTFRFGSPASKTYARECDAVATLVQLAHGPFASSAIRALSYLVYNFRPGT